MSRRSRGSLRTALGLALACGLAAPSASAAGPSPRRAPGALPAATAAVLERHCYKCHAGADAEADIDLPKLLSSGVGAGFKAWQRVARALEEKDMPPEEERQPTEAQRRELVTAIRDNLRREAEAQARDPGPVVMRRLTSAEYAYTIEDLTGLALDLGRDFGSDAVGGEGFVNVGGAQFMQDSTLERYLEVAKSVASHAVVGSGPLGFFRDPGKTGLELSAVDRIVAIYRRYGFRNAAGEGGEPFGLDRYPKAFAAAWRYRHREALRLAPERASLAALAAAEGLAPRFLEHVWSVLTERTPTFPLSDVIATWRALPAPVAGREPPGLPAACDGVFRHLVAWQLRLAPNVANQEQAVVFAEAPWTVTTRHAFKAGIELAEDGTGAEVLLSALPVDASRPAGPLVVWRDARVRFRSLGKRWSEPRPLSEVLAPAEVAKLGFGKAAGGRALGPRDFATAAGSSAFVLAAPAGATSAELTVAAELDPARARASVVRAAIRRSLDKVKDGEEVWAFLGEPGGPAFAGWIAGVRDLARKLPQISHREPVPSDRDPITEPFDNSYNNEERNHFHARLKYHRDDRFLVEHFLDDEARRRLDEAWTDLWASFDYHDSFLAFLAQKYGLRLGGRGVAALDAATIEGLPEPARAHVRRLHEHHAAVGRALAAAESRHVDDAVRFARRAWRRPLADGEARALAGYYADVRRRGKLDHDKAIRLLLARILMAPDFLYRAERTADRPAHAPLSDFELASRLSYFLWSSPPDEALDRAAEAGALRDPARLAAEARRMLADPRARRLATELFGQWFGFYQFDRYGGVDAQRFPELTDRIKQAMYDEAISFFEHIVRADRPVDEILFADYTFLDRELAAFYGVEAPGLGARPIKVQGVSRFHRGGLLGLGAILTVTSAPLRTSPVKRGDWILRRVLGTPVPPPPANAGSIAADDVADDRQTVRARLEAHRGKPACINCHSRIDPLGFALERFDATGRWRERYRDGEPIGDSGTLLDGTDVRGPAGLAAYLKAQRKLFHRTLATKLVGYALGRGQQISDQPLIDALAAWLGAGEARVSQLVTDIVTSTAFRFHRGRAERPAISAALEPARPEGGRP